MPLGNAPGHRKPDAEAGGLTAAGGVCPVETVKQLVCLQRLPVLAGVFTADHHAPLGLFQREPDLPAGGGVLHCVVQQQGGELPHGVFVAPVCQPRLDVQHQTVALGVGVVRK